jgi:serralysin
MAAARSLGLKVTLKPQVDLITGAWRGTIAPTDPNAWFTSYEAMIDHYADLAKQGGATMLVIGTEFKTMSGAAYTARWQQIIAGIRQRFSGRLTYAANWNEYQQVRFWGDLDFIGVDAYYPLSELPAPALSQLVSAWTSRGYVNALQSVSQQYGKQVLFTEIGYRSIVGAAVTPNIWNSQALYSMDEEANAYEAAFRAFSGKSWFAGMYWWSWPAALPANGWNGDYTPTYKPAEDVMRSWNQRLGGSPAPAPAPLPASAIPAQAVVAVPTAPQHALPVEHKIVQKKAKKKRVAKKRHRRKARRHH